MFTSFYPQLHSCFIGLYTQFVLSHFYVLPADTCVFVDVEDDDNEEDIILQTSSDPTEALNRELHHIRLDLQRYQQDKTQLQYVLFFNFFFTIIYLFIFITIECNFSGWCH